MPAPRPQFHGQQLRPAAFLFSPDSPHRVTGHASSSDGHEEDIAISVLPLSADATEVALADRAALLKCHWLLVGSARTAESGELVLEARLFDRTAGRVTWQAEQTGPIGDAAALGEKRAALVRPWSRLRP